MKTNKPEKVLPDEKFRNTVQSLYPVAKGSLAQVRKACANPNCQICKSGEKHPSWIFGYVENGKRKCMHVQPRHVETIRKAIENGRALERMILEEGLDLIRRLREDSKNG